MLIDVCISCIEDDKTNQSECRLLLQSLDNYRNDLKRDRAIMGEALADQLLYQLDSITESIQDAMIYALEGLQPIQASDGKGGYRFVYESRKTATKNRS